MTDDESLTFQFLAMMFEEWTMDELTYMHMTVMGETDAVE